MISAFFLALGLCCLVEGYPNNFPIIGIFAQPSTSHQGDCGGDCQMLAASYVKYIEASGARVVPVNFHSTTAELDTLFTQLNGFLFPGGGSSFPAAAQYVFDKTVEANKKGDFSPLWGTCQGFQWLLMSASRNANVLDPRDGTVMDSENYSVPLQFTDNAPSSKMYSRAGADVMNILSTMNVTMNNHHYGIWVDHFFNTDSLSSFFDVLSTNRERGGKEFVSGIEAKRYPIFGTQWHPEKNNFEWAKQSNGLPYEVINHSHEAVQVAQYHANFFVEQARHSTHQFESWEAESKALIYNYQPTRTTGDFVQQYFFHF